MLLEIALGFRPDGTALPKASSRGSRRQRGREEASQALNPIQMLNQKTKAREHSKNIIALNGSTTALRELIFDHPTST
jgi:hypothetical protein